MVLHGIELGTQIDIVGTTTPLTSSLTSCPLNYCCSHILPSQHQRVIPSSLGILHLTVQALFTRTAAWTSQGVVVVKPPLLSDGVGTVCHKHVIHGLLVGAVQALVAGLVHHVARLREDFFHLSLALCNLSPRDIKLRHDTTSFHLAYLCEVPLLVPPATMAANHAHPLSGYPRGGWHLGTHFLPPQLTILG
ncbi:hypothetical protein E2C01_022051 [Portunus trituberculatus]|uniref:Uncharacterized protein n=1 Tax=Portunus trituberculatus TaxID=210409 RepID=A0A5B7E4E4_PORTR|nr:hypothetical protein [Portunus trituberculatus]